MALLSVIRRWHHRDGIGIRDIARRTGLSRNTVRKYLASQILEPRYPKRIAPAKLDGDEAGEDFTSLSTQRLLRWSCSSWAFKKMALACFADRLNSPRIFFSRSVSSDEMTPS